MKYRRVALFMDYENLSQTLRHASSPRESLRPQVSFGPSGLAVIDFVELARWLEEKYGPIRPSDFIVVANFSHFDAQKGGLNRVATLIHVDTFESRTVRKQVQSSPGKKFVMENAADMRLAYEIGRHVMANPAELYLICSGDKAFTPVARALVEQGTDVRFLFPDADSAAIILKEEFKWEDLQSILKEISHRQALSENLETGSEVQKNQQGSLNEPTEVLLTVISKLRQEFSAPVPLVLVSAMAGPGQAGALIQRAISQGKIDLWKSPEGIECVSRREERLLGKVVPMSVRMDLVIKARILEQVAKIGELQPDGLSLPGWRNALRQEGGYSNNQAKRVLQALTEVRILPAGQLNARPDLSYDSVIRFLKTDFGGAT